MDAAFAKLLSPLRLRAFELRNRVICTGHNPVLHGPNGELTDDEIAFHARKADGGIALSTTGGTSVHPSGGVHGGLVSFDDSVIPGYQRLAEAMHSRGALMLVQLAHGSSAASSRHSGYPKWAPSQTYGAYSDELPHVMTGSEIDEVVDAFRLAADRVRRGGLDGVEVSAFAGGLIAQFLSPAANRRTDGWGGDLEGRARLLIEILRACREGVGDGLVALKLVGDDLTAEGFHITEAQGVIRLIERDRHLVDYYVAAVGTNLDRLARVAHMPPSPVPDALYAYVAKAMKEVSGKPVAALGRIVSPAIGNQLIRDGDCDLVAMVRATIADPDIVRKTVDGRIDEIRSCVGANVCVDRIIDGGPVRCIYNAEAGRERTLGRLPHAGRRRRVVVVGGGPAGLEAARVAALMGHDVRLLERSHRLGGNVLLAARQPSRGHLSYITDWLVSAASRAGAVIETGVEATVELLESMSPDDVVVATGATHLDAETSDLDYGGAPIVAAWQVLEGTVPVGRDVLIVDPTGKLVGLSIAELVAEAGGRSRVISPHFHPAQFAGLTNAVTAYRRILAKDVELIAHHELVGVDAEGALIADVYSSRPRSLSDFDQVVIVTHPAPNDLLMHELRSTLLKVRGAGDCVAPRDIEYAVFEGYRAARLIDEEPFIEPDGKTSPQTPAGT